MKKILLWFLCACALAWSQQSVDTAMLHGRVEDPSGAAIPGATAVVDNLNTGRGETVTTDPTGAYRFHYMPPGDYRLRIEAPGFQSFEQPIKLSLGQAFFLPVRLQVATQEASVSVNDTVPLIETAKTQSSELVEYREVEKLPLNGRNYLDLALLVPGVSRTNTGSNQRFAETSAVPGTGISINGQRNLNNTFIVDGLSANDDAAELAGTFYGQDVIREFQVVRSGGIAEFGRASSGVINIATRSGGNTLHGDLYGYLRNQRMDARNPLTAVKLPLTQGQYGASLNGPIVRDRTFYFANFEQTRQNASGVMTIDPAQVGAINAQLLAAGYPGPLVETGSFPATLHSSNFFARLDHAVTDKDQLSVRYNFYDMESLNARNVGGLNAVSRAFSLDDRDNVIGANNVLTIAPNIVNESRFQYVRSRFASPPNDLVGPAVNINGVANFGTATFSPTRRDIDAFEIANNLTYQTGKHSYKMGADYLQERVRIDFPGALQGVYTFAPSTPTPPANTNLANFLAGKYINFQQAFGEPITRQDNPNVGIFGQDEWQLRPGVTLNLGIRYDLQFLPDPVATDWNNVSPRAGIAWAPGGDGKTVVRASYGLFFDRLPLRAVSNALQRDGVKYKVAVLSFGQPGAPAFPNVLSAFPSGLLTNVTTVVPTIQEGYSHQAAVEVERQLWETASLRVGFNHLRGENILMSRNVNVPLDQNVPANRLVFNGGRPDPTVANNSQYQALGDSWYDGLTVSFNQRPTRWASMRVAYTYSKALDTAGNFFFSTPQDNVDIAAEKGRSDNDQRHRVSISGSVYSPTAPSHGWAQHLTHGWLLSFFYDYTSSLPFNILSGTDRNGDTNNNDRPIGVGRNTGIGFEFHSLDLRLERTFHIAERGRLLASVDAFNALNHRNDQVPSAVFGANVFVPGSGLPTFGRPTAAGDPRQIQLGLKVNF